MTTKKPIPPAKIYIREDLICAGMSEFGSELSGTVLSIVLERPNGVRYGSRETISAFSVDISDDGFTYVIDEMETAMVKAETKRAELEERYLAQGLDPETWVKIESSYGSLAWQAEDDMGMYR